MDQREIDEIAAKINGDIYRIGSIHLDAYLDEVTEAIEHIFLVEGKSEVTVKIEKSDNGGVNFKVVSKA